MSGKVLALVGVLLAPLGGSARADVVISPPMARADSPGLAIEVTPVLPSQRHLVDVEGNATPACEPDPDDDGCTPLLPLGSMYVAITNKTALPIVVAPRDVTVLARGVRYRVLGTPTELDKRWHDAAWLVRIGPDDPRQVMHDRLPLMNPVTIPPKTVVRGYIVFDYKGSLASDYEDFLRTVEQVFVILQTRSEKLVATFVVR